MNRKQAKRVIAGIVIGAIGLGGASLLAGCHQMHGHHAMVSNAGYETLGCQQCYDEIIRVKRTLPSSKPIGAGYTVHREHHCSECNANMTIYSEDGQLMVKCARCAPEGKACDKCLPPKKAT